MSLKGRERQFPTSERHRSVAIFSLSLADAHECPLSPNSMCSASSTNVRFQSLQSTHAPLVPSLSLSSPSMALFLGLLNKCLASPDPSMFGATRLRRIQGLGQLKSAQPAQEQSTSK
jgi:hypothetical protein